MRRDLANALHDLAVGKPPVKQPVAEGEWVERGAGHFHLAPELFVQLSGWSLFRFPQGELRLQAGELLLLPPKLQHMEQIGSEEETPFSNLVIYAEHSAFSCHLANEKAPGEPGILHLEAGHHPEAQHIQHWLTDAARLGRQLRSIEQAGWRAAQIRALVLAAGAGVIRALDDLAAEPRLEPPLIARLRVLIHNQLGDHQLSVRGLATQLGCTADYLSHLFRQHGGEALAGYINRQRMERAAHLLCETRLAIKEVAWSCGFDAPSYFIRIFRSHYGMTPKTWREGRRADGR
ncbi:helix-turn-helix transcriptional regulator [Crenobacter sp. SG2303]|uniref:Helix-turn-helix transcriptional regulator n=1 Tax=Crenobacter oryzisoli TaxID=3056844 RepID=A0ABT7XRQ9_9NEIS|nr:helix-turn-helix transcriptional regulator [Crenobacter sp. SG2303]MDN0076486.1 helix-turn-helix transcriptional regulator [Crenobacter sp. SG2303]